MFSIYKDGKQEIVKFTTRGRVYLALAGRNLYVIERERLVRVWIQAGPTNKDATRLCWLNFGESGDQAFDLLLHNTELGSNKKLDRNIACEIYDSIVDESANILWREDDAGNWRRLDER